MEEEIGLEKLNNNKEESQIEISKEEKEFILKSAIGDWGNEFSKSLTPLEIAELIKKSSSLFSSKGEKFVPKLFWERYDGQDKEKILALEKDYTELAEMRKVIEEHVEIMEDVYNFLEENLDYKSEEFWNKISEFKNKARLSWEIFEENKMKLSERIKQEKEFEIKK